MSELTIVRGKKTTAQRILDVFGRSAVNVFLLLIAVFWLVPSVGLFIASLRPASASAASGWWTV
ncbi:MAG: carbohydrate ABC transporter permease, partial [Mycetocola sp.]